MKSRIGNILKGLSTFVAVVGGLISLALTINLAIQIFGADNAFWIVIGVLVGCIFNASEVACFLRWVQQDELVALVLGICLALVSASASVGALQISLERGAVQSTDYTQKLKEIELIDQQIAKLQETAEKQKAVYHVTKSRETLDQATQLLKKRNKAQNELILLRTQNAGLNTALYRAYANLLGLSVMKVALWINILVSLLIEIVFVYFTTSSASKNKIILVADDNNGQTENSEVVIVSQRPDQVNSKNRQSKSTIVSQDVNPETQHSIGFQFANDVNIGTNLSPESPPESQPKKTSPEFRVNKKTVIRLQRLVDKLGGKSDPVILYFWDQGERNRARIGRKVKSVLGYKVSRQYVSRVVKRERGV